MCIRDRAQSVKLEYVAKMYEILSNYVDFPEFNVPKIEFIGNDDPLEMDSPEVMAEIEKIANHIRESWELGRGPIKNLQFILEEHGIVITGFQLNESKIDAFSQRIHMKNGATIFIIALALGSKPKERLNLDIAHELGHILLHPWGESIDLIDKAEFNGREKQANMFASALLLPKETFGEDIKMYPTDLAYYQFMKRKWKMSIQAMMYRARQLDIITMNQYQYMICLLYTSPFFYRCRVLEEEFRFRKIGVAQCGGICVRGGRRNSGIHRNGCGIYCWDFCSDRT